MSVAWIEHQGVKILYYNCQKLSEDQIIRDLDQVMKLIRTHPGKMVILMNAEGAFLTKDFLENAKQSTKQLREEDKGFMKVQKIAMVGMDSLKSLLLQGYNIATGQNIKPFKTEDEAKEWLIQP